jgi:hypothetical protein
LIINNSWAIFTHITLFLFDANIQLFYKTTAFSHNFTTAVGHIFTTAVGYDFTTAVGHNFTTAVGIKIGGAGWPRLLGLEMSVF